MILEIKDSKMQLKEILNDIPLILQFYVPGFIFLSIFRYLTSKIIKDSQSGVILSVVVSYALISITEILTTKLNLFKDSVLIKSGITIVFGSVVSIIFALLFRSVWFSKALAIFFNKTPNDDIWMDILDFKKGSNLKIYERGKDYYVTGHHFVNEEKGSDSWFAITAYSKKNFQNDDIIEDHSKDDKAIFVVRLCDVEHIEIF